MNTVVANRVIADNVTQGVNVPAAVRTIVTAIKNPSDYQYALFDWVVNGSGSAMVEAVAGSGKTTTGVEMVKLAVQMGLSHIYLAFNKSIATELAARGVNGRTFHSLTYGVVTRFKNVRNVDGDKLRKLCRELLNEKQQRAYGQFVAKLVGLARQAGIGAGLAPGTHTEWLELALHHDLEPDSDNASMDEGIQLAQQLLAASNDSDMVDFDDLLYVAVKENLSLPKFDFVFVDEAQDTNAIQRALIRKIMKSNTRLVAVGDPAQAIYGFRGADSDSMDLLAQDFGCVKMPLTVTYRCAKSIVEFAHNWVEHIEAAPGAPDGAVTDLYKWDHTVFAAQDLVVCRTTKPLISLAYRLIRNRVAAHVMGREIGAGLKSLVNKMNAKGVDALVDKLNAYTDREVKKHLDNDDAARAEAVRDKTDCILVIIEGMPETDRSVPGVLRAIDELFNDQAGGVKLATIHKAKGLEAHKVFWLNSSKCPAQWAKQDWQRQQEQNLCYVAATRAKAELVLIEDEGLKA
jgi:DNA helicase-2/ATP-dependent DNA helicase PcrA